MKTAEANEMYTKFLVKLGKAYKPEKIKGKKELQKLYKKLRSIYDDENDFNFELDGVFGAMMQVDIVNEGPVTIELDSRKFTYTA